MHPWLPWCTHALAAVVWGLGLYGDPHSLWSAYALSMGSMALAGSLTNSLAIFMIFEPIPLVYGSGVITRNFQGFMTKLGAMVMDVFFHKAALMEAAPMQKLAENLIQDMDETRFVRACLERLRQEGHTMLSFFNIEPMLLEAMPLLKETLIHQSQEMLAQEGVQSRFDAHMRASLQHHIEQRLQTITAPMVKRLVHDLIDAYLAHLVIWGALGGAAMGAAAVCLKNLL